MFDQITSFVKENQKQLFELFWTTTIPHAAIQAPQRWGMNRNIFLFLKVHTDLLRIIRNGYLKNF
jgi:hypothetical protein